MAQTTIVFDINLPDDEESHEWSYLELVQEHLVKNTNEGSVSDPFAEADRVEEKRLAELAKSLEKKYGTMVTMQKSGSRKRVRIDDFLDPGDGYDSQDSFIDDSEATDIYVAPNVSTKLGGFFVHEGVVEGLEDQNARIEAPVGARQKTNSITRPVKKDKSKELLEKAVKRLSAPKVSPNVSRTKMHHLDAVLDVVLSESTASKHSSEDSSTTPSKSEGATPIDVKASPPKSAPNQQSETPEKSNLPALPSSIPAELANRIEGLIKSASPNGSQQIRIVSKPFNTELLNLAVALNAAKLSQTTRSAIFAHMEARLQWKRKSIARRLRKLSEENEDQKMNPLLDALSDAISRAMPALLEAYAKDKELHAERVKAWQQENRLNGTETSESQTNTGTAEGSAVKRNPKPGAPKKIFRWNSESRNLFHSIVTRRLESYQVLNIKGPREEYLKALFPTLIQLWPEGWITNAALWRTALPVFQRFSAEHPIGNQTTTTPKAIPPANSVVQPPVSCASASPAPDTHLEVSDAGSKPVSLFSALKGKPSTPTFRQSSSSPLTTPTCSSTKSASLDSVTACTVTLQPITTATINNDHQPVSTQISRKPITDSSQSTASASATGNLQQAIRTMLESKSAKLNTSTEHIMNPANRQRHSLLTESHAAIPSMVQLNARHVTAAATTVTNNTQGVQSKTSHSSQPVFGVTSTPVAQTVNRAQNQTSFIRSPSSGRSPSVPSTSINGVAPTAPNEHHRSTGPVIHDSSVRVAPVKRQTVPMAHHRTPESLHSVATGFPAPFAQKVEPSRLLAASNILINAHEKQARQQSTTTVSLSTTQIDQLQQRAVSCSARAVAPVNPCNPLLAATALLLQQSQQQQQQQPPPAHQQQHPSSTTSYYTHRVSDTLKNTPVAHSGNHITKIISSPSPRTINQAFPHPASGNQS